MLFGAVTLSELPISTSWQQQPNGEEFYYDFSINQVLSLDLDINQEEEFILSISTSSDYELSIKK